MDHFTALRVFRLVVEQGSFSAAARTLLLSPAAVSKNIAELEAHLSTRLLNRTTRRMSLTEAGTQYYQHVVRIMDDLAEAESALSPLSETPAGLLRVSAPMSLTLTAFSEVIPSFLKRYPDLTLDLHLDDRRVDLVKEGYDLAIRGSDNLEDSSLVARKLLTMTHVLCAAPSYFDAHGIPATPDALRQHNCLQFSLSAHATDWVFRQGDRVVRVPIQGRYRVSSSLAVRDALRAGVGLSLIPLVYVRDDLARGSLKAVLQDWAMMETYVYAVYPSRRYVAAKVRAFLAFLIEHQNQPVS